jgi:hypothetical protein
MLMKVLNFRYQIRWNKIFKLHENFYVVMNQKDLLTPSFNKKVINTKHNFKITSLILLLCVLMLIKIPAQCQGFSAAEWKFESQREAIAPVSYVDNKISFRGNQTLTLKGGGKDYADGHWYKQVNVEPGKYFKFRAYFKTSGVDEPKRSILARILWQNKSGEPVGFTEYPATLEIKRKKAGVQSNNYIWYLLKQRRQK